MKNLHVHGLFGQVDHHVLVVREEDSINFYV